MNLTPILLASIIGIVLFTISAKQVWATPLHGLPYESYFKDATKKYNLPPELLSRMAKQESDYNPTAFNPSGAVGLMQIIPRWHPNINPNDPVQSIYYAGLLMRQYYNEFKSWPKALAAYNWGETNVRNKGLEQAPVETQNYMNNILTDIGLR